MQLYKEDYAIISIQNLKYTPGALIVWTPVFTSSSITLHHSQFYTMSLSSRQLLFSVNVIKRNHTKLSYCTFNNASDLQSIVDCMPSF